MSEGKNTVMLVLSYLGLLSLIPYFVAKDDAEVRWHAAQGLLMCATVAIVAVCLVVVGICGAFIPIVNIIVGLLLLLCWGVLGLGYIGLSIFCIVKAVKGERFMVPVISNYVEKIL